MRRPAIYLGFLRLILVVSWLVLRLSAPANALDPSRQISQYAHTVWRIQDGDFGSAPHAITQTADGYLWIGTDYGLVRFDGVRFVPWTAPPGNHLTDSTILSLLGARDGSLWVGTRTGLDKIQADDLVHYSNARGRVNKIVEDHDGAIWIVRSRVRDGKGPLCHPTGNTLRCFGKEDGVSFPVATALVEDKFGNLWIGSSQGIFRWKAGQTETFISNGLRQNENMSGVESLIAEPDGSLTVGIGRSGKGLGLQRFRDGAWSDYAAMGISSHELVVPTLLMDHNNVLWVGTWRHGLFRIHDGKAEHFGTANGLSSDSVENLFQDREGNLWVTTSKGIDRFRDVRVASFSIVRE